MKKYVAVLSMTLALSSPGWAATRTTTLVVDDMTCSTCPVTIKKVLNRIAGVQKIDFRVEAKEVQVSFDDAKTTVSALIKATADAGYPSRVK
ncbi:mercury resistance system periplasmic binding protein MerP [Pseudoxanthomonas sp. SE1]|uniref:mercury resistance system periplasmic binding protein MerP n=1 Tax=Pseudoxanthomonas sp. SE1 TaxID=1664560 RepID=UPI00240D73AA|nr:mercury resistance system periplasmic binding protein MerP [Pseudoxanthomonas sp. SE1]WFC40275.1 mercury resistance system periplasmic binding protein MerP [Pseudoxanthomonas sp. SE1]WFC43722.1 mercury resistance system periplasmic binding protein MerP [Pseudoxanthomonas sp. SE1]